MTAGAPGKASVNNPLKPPNHCTSFEDLEGSVGLTEQGFHLGSQV